MYEQQRKTRQLMYKEKVNLKTAKWIDIYIYIYIFGRTIPLLVHETL